MLFLTYKRGPQIKSNEYRYGNENASLACCSAFVFYCKGNSLFCSLFFHYRRSLREVFVFFLRSCSCASCRKRKSNAPSPNLHAILFRYIPLGCVRKMEAYQAIRSKSRTLLDAYLNILSVTSRTV